MFSEPFSRKNCFIIILKVLSNFFSNVIKQSENVVLKNKSGCVSDTCGVCVTLCVFLSLNIYQGFPGKSRLFLTIEGASF